MATTRSSIDSIGNGLARNGVKWKSHERAKKKPQKADNGTVLQLISSPYKSIILILECARVIPNQEIFKQYATKSKKKNSIQVGADGKAEREKGRKI